MSEANTVLPRPRLAQATLLLASTLTVMAGATISPALPGIEETFANAPPLDLLVIALGPAVLVGLVLTTHGLFIAVGSPLIGAVADRFGRRRLLLLSTVVYALAGGSGFVLDSLVGILVGRGILGLAVAGITVTVTALITDYYEEDYRNTVLGRQAAFMAFGGVLLLPLGGVLADVGWRFPFLVYTVSVLLLPAMILSLPEPERTEPTGDRPTDFAALRRTLARVPLGTLALVYAVGLIGQLVFYMIPVQGPFYLESQTGISPTLVGVTLGLSTLSGGIVSIGYGRIRKRASVITIVAFTFGFMSVGYVIVGLSGSLLGILVGLVIAGFGTGLLLPNLNTWLTAAVPESVRGRALGGLTSAYFFGQFLSPIVTRPIADVVGLATTFRWVGVAMAGGALAFGLAAVVASPPAETEADEQPAD